MLYFFAAIMVLAAVMSVIYLIKRLSSVAIEVDPAKQKPQYDYQAKEYFMTKSESDFFRMLDGVAGDRYYIFPQAHLSAILNHKVTGQDWRAAFRHINGKSVDYVLCDRNTLKPIYAVQLDDYTHNYSERQARDLEVARIFNSVGIPLVRFSNYKTLSQEDIAKKFFEVSNK